MSCGATISQGSTGAELLPSSRSQWLSVNLSPSCAAGLRASVSYWLVARDCPRFLEGSPLSIIVRGKSQGENTDKTEVTVCCKRLLGVTFHHLRRKSPCLAFVHDERRTQRCECQRAGRGASGARQSCPAQGLHVEFIHFHCYVGSCVNTLELTLQFMGLVFSPHPGFFPYEP